MLRSRARGPPRLAGPHAVRGADAAVAAAPGAGARGRVGACAHGPALSKRLPTPRGSQLPERHPRPSRINLGFEASCNPQLGTIPQKSGVRIWSPSLDFGL